jgi:hypothetical protein
LDGFLGISLPPNSLTKSIPPACYETRKKAEPVLSIHPSG